MIGDLYKGLYAYYTANPSDAFFVSTGGRFYFMTVPETVIKPYVCAYDVVTPGPSYWFSHTFQRSQIQLSVYVDSSSAETAAAIEKQAKAFFDLARFAVSGWSLISFIRQLDVMLHDEVHEEFHHSMTYEALLQKAR